MSSIYLPVFRSNAAQDAATRLPSLLTAEVKSKDALAFCEQCRIRGIAGLLLDGAPDPLHVELRRSGRALLHALPRIPEKEKATGKLLPIFDAIAAGDWECARAIASHARTTWNPDEEYEEDFLFVFWLMQRFLLDRPEPTCQAVLDRWTDLLDDAVDLRLDVANALQHGGEGSFERSLEAYLDDESACFRRLSASGAIAQEIEATFAYVNVEAIALVRLARTLGLSLRSDYRGVPSIALEEPRPLHGAEWWEDV